MIPPAPTAYFSKERLTELMPALYAFARTLYHQQNDVDDLVQETLLKALANREKYLPYSSLRSWLFTIMKNIFYTRLHLAKREAPASKGCVSTSYSAAINPSQDSALEMQDVEAAIHTLPIKYQRVLLLITIEGQSYQRTAQICNCTIGTVKSRLNRARSKLQNKIEGID